MTHIWIRPINKWIDNDLNQVKRLNLSHISIYNTKQVNHMKNQRDLPITNRTKIHKQVKKEDRGILPIESHKA